MTEWWNDLPSTQVLTEPRRTAEREQLVALITSPDPVRRSRPLLFAATGVAVLSATGAGLAALNDRVVEDPREVRCHTTLDVGRGMEFAGTATELRHSDRRRGITDDAVESCADLWEFGVLRLGEPDPQAPLPDPQPVPPLLACVTEDGLPAVFPAEDATCASLGLEGLSR